MSLKSIEMQVALPRTFEAQKIHDQLSQRGQIINNQAEQKMKQEELKLRSSVLKQEQKDKATLNHGEDHSKEFKENDKKKDKNSKNEIQHTREKHPYKGNFLDFSG